MVPSSVVSLVETVSSQISAANMGRLKESHHLRYIYNYMEVRQGVVHSACCWGFLLLRRGRQFEQAFLQCGPGHVSVHTSNRMCSRVAQITSECCLTDRISSASSEAFTPFHTAVRSLRTDVNTRSEEGLLWVFFIWNFYWRGFSCQR